MRTTLIASAHALASGATTSRALAEKCLAHAASDEGSRVFIKIWAEQALKTATEHDSLRRNGVVRSCLAGLPITIKDVFDVTGETTLAGSTVLKNALPAEADALVVRRLKAAGMVLLGRTNMSEFAFSAVGLNPHYGTPGNPWDRSRIPGGSSSGAAVSVADGMALAAIGTDTGGSVRIPAALCGLVGFKPTKSRVPADGTVPLSTTLDSIGPLANCVADCVLLDAIMAGQRPTLEHAVDVRGLRLAVPQTVVLDNLDNRVADAFGRVLTSLSNAGAVIIDIPLALLRETERANANGGFPPAEAFAWHQALLASRGEEYDPRARARIECGRHVTASEYIRLCWQREDLIARAERESAPYDAMLVPTCPVIAPRRAEVEADDDVFWRYFGLLARNTKLINFLNGCAVTVPIQGPGEAPVGLMIAGRAFADDRLLAIARGIEKVLHPSLGEAMAQPFSS